MIFKYFYPMVSIGLSAIFHYKKDNQIYLLLQRRSMNMSHAPGQIGATGGYYDAHVVDEEKFETLPHGLRREIYEEIGHEFEKSLPEDIFTMKNISQIRHKLENKHPAYTFWQSGIVKLLKLFGYKPKLEKQVNMNFVWVVEITEEQAQKAIIEDPNEVAEIIHLPLTEVSTCKNIRPWIPEIIKELENKGWFT